MKIAIYPGSFDPIHNGHIEIIKKSLKLFDKVFVVVSYNPEKEDQSDINLRLENANKMINLPNVEVIVNRSDLTVDVATKLKARWIIRSARNDFDYDYEIKMAAANKSLNSKIETVIIIPDMKNIHYSSTLVKQGVK